jgi:anti-sigma factor RsiW
MTCDSVTERLDDYLDGSLGEAEFQEIELHLHDCAACRREERALRALLAEAAALPREVAPSRDLWPGIAQRIGAPARVVPFRRRWLSAGYGALAAAVVLALGALVLRQQPAPQPAAPAAQRVTVVSTTEDASLGQAGADYVRATADLMTALEARRPRLAPETLKVVDENLRIIDDALTSLREALKTDPQNGQLAHMLAATHRKKVDVLRRVMKLKA